MMSESQPVFNLSIADVHEYYASGVLVSNCDAAHYVIELANQWTREQAPKGPEPGSKEARLAEMQKYKKDAIARGEQEPD